MLWRKGSFGTSSAEGSRFVERIMTVNATLRLHQRNVLEYLTEACHAALHHQPAPRLLPAADAKAARPSRRLSRKLAAAAGA